MLTNLTYDQICHEHVTYLGLRQQGERFLDTYRRLGIQPFREKLYGAH